MPEQMPAKRMLGWLNMTLLELWHGFGKLALVNLTTRMHSLLTGEPECLRPA